jgi:hypothetical protein
VRPIWISILLSATLLLGTGRSIAQPDAAMRKGFADPPQEAKLRCYWWWLNGYTTGETITRDLTGMKAKGYGGVILVDAWSSDGIGPPFGPAYGSPAWMKLYLHALDVAAGLGLEVSLSITDGGNVGILGGHGVEPKEALKRLAFARVTVVGGSGEVVRLGLPETVNGFYREVAVLAYPLRHGAGLAGGVGSRREAIEDLAFKAATRETGDSMPVSEHMLREGVSVAGEQDTDLRNVVDLTGRMRGDGVVDWKAPAGEWEVLRVGYTDTSMTDSMPDRPGLAVDVLNQAAFDRYWDRVVVPVLEASKPYVGRSLRYLVTDSWEAGAMNWTDGFRDKFMRRRGYDLLPYLPVVAGRIVESREVSDRFLADLRRTVGDLLAENYYDRFAEKAAGYGLGTHAEAGGPHGGPMDALRNFREASMMQTEFWAASTFHRIADEDRFFVKEASSAAHIYGKRYVAAEGFSRMGPPWDVSPGRNLKPAFDRALTEGLNRLFWHEYTSSPEALGKPGLEYFADTHLDPNVTWWEQAGPMLQALNRAQFLLQQGEPVADLLYDYGTQVPNFVRLKADDPAHVLPGYDYDVTDEDALLGRMQVAGAEVRTPEGVGYRALALPASRRLSLGALRWVEGYVRQGGAVIGLKPLSPLGLIPEAGTAEFDKTVAAMWGRCGEDAEHVRLRYGLGWIYCTEDSRAALGAMHVAADFSYRSEPGVVLDYVHRRAGNVEIYFVRNEKDAEAKAVLSFRVKGMAPELWDVDAGEVRPALVYRESGDRTEVPLTLAGHGSMFVIFEKAAEVHVVALERSGAEVFPSSVMGAGVFGVGNLGLGTAEAGTYDVELSDGRRRRVGVAPVMTGLHMEGRWAISFPHGSGGPEAMTMDRLQSWTESPNAGVRYFSGTATYRSKIDVTDGVSGDGREVWMDLGDVREVVTVLVNGKEVGTLWHPPFLVRIDGALRGGSNEVELRVTNLWPNRLIGDEQPSEVVRSTKTNVHVYTKDSPLLPSGLLGPVTLRVMSVQVLR